MRRYASIDFLRGLAIFLMLFVHMVSEYLDIDTEIDDVENAPLISIIVLIILQFIGGLAGLFLLVSAIGNMVSMYRHLQAGKPVKDLVIKQVIGGIILLFFAYLAEGLIGNNGVMGDVASNIDNISVVNWRAMLYNGYNFETIHTIAWCIILNGIVHGILSRNEGWKNPRKLIKIYLVLAIIIVASTQFVWEGLRTFGYPNTENPNTGQPLAKPVLGVSSFGEIVLGFFLNALAAPMEPLFPYLVVSFAGSIIGIMISQKREVIPRDFPKKVMWVGFIMFIVGVVGIFIMLFPYLDSGDVYTFAEIWRHSSYHRHWYPDIMPVVTFPLAWLWQFIAFNGFAILATMTIIRVVEFRGNGSEFAKKTTFFRRFGFIAFTMYVIQWIYKMNRVWFRILLWGDKNASMGWGPTLILICISLAMFQVIMVLWEKVKYTGSLEWCIGVIASIFMPSRRKGKKWWQAAQLDVDGAFYNAEWLNIVEKEEIDHENLEGSKFSKRLGRAGVLSILLLPTGFISIALALKARKQEGINKHNTAGLVWSIIAIGLFIALFTSVSFLTGSFLGL
ncbi:MAG: hypothetical protein ACFFCS_28945 [Candidatus Hodarchaeota archaeon]